MEIDNCMLTFVDLLRQYGEWILTHDEFGLLISEDRIERQFGLIIDSAS
jgi:hypothetical protein